MSDSIPASPPGLKPGDPLFTEASQPRTSPLATEGVAHFQSALSAAEPVKAASVVPVAPAKVPWLNSQAHITLSGLAMFIFMAIGIIWPQYKPKADELAVAAGTYLFASAKAK